jgi:excisionase family DNA binding protein
MAGLQGEVFNADDVAKHLKVSKRTLLREVHEGRLEAFRVGKSLRFTLKAVEEYKEKQKVKPGEELEEEIDELAA